MVSVRTSSPLPVSGVGVSLSPMVTMNYLEDPYSEGGVQIYLMDTDSWTVVESAAVSSQPFSTDGEQVTWTQRLAISAGTVTFSILDGQSATIGPFSEPQLSLSQATSDTSLASYDPNHSETESGIGFGSNRVQRLALNEIRYYNGATLVARDSTPRVLAEL